MDTMILTGVRGRAASRPNFRADGVTPVVPVQQQAAATPVKSNSTLEKATPIVTSAVALASLGLATYALVKNPRQIKELGNKLDGVTHSLADTTNGLKESISKVEEKVTNEVSGLKTNIDGVRTNFEQTVNEVRTGFNDGLNGVRGELNEVRSTARAAHGVNMLSRDVEINGQHFQLASVMHGYGKEEGKLTDTLRTESTRRILGAVKPIELPENAMIRVPTAEYAGFAKTGGLAIVPKELTANLGAVINNKQKAELIVDTPMYLGQVENSQFFSIVKKGDKYQYINKKNGKENVMATMSKIDEMHVPIYTDKGKSVERVEVFMSDEMRTPVDYEDTLTQFDEKTAAEIREAIASGKEYDTHLVKFTPPADVDEGPKAEVKYHTVFYKNDKFNMSGPVQDGKVKNIYNDQTTAAGETERNVYFGKYFYENLLSNHETADKKLKADLIIGNDWHTGPISAMTRLLTPAKKAMGLEPELADKVQNTPIITIMHNFKLQGTVWHSQDKLLNVMFGEHAAKIAENAWMPQKAGMPGHLMNGLFSGRDLNPQTMAMSYADDIVFVSRGNFNEAANVMEKGGTNFALASMRGRTHQYADRAYLEEIGMAAGIRPEEVGKYPTAKGITNGCDRVNNALTGKKARTLETQLNLRVGSLMCDDKAKLDPFMAHQNNKKVYLAKVVEEVKLARDTKGKENPLKIHDPAHTDLTGVDENTLVFGMAGRIVDQKGIDIYASGYEEFIRRGNYDKANPPVCWLNGIGDEQYINAFMASKARVSEIDPLAGQRMIFSGVFGEAGRYDGTKMMSDISVMSSWDEPCGLVHKEIGYTSGSVSMVNEVGGLRDGLKGYIKDGGDKNQGANSIFVKFVDKDTHSYDDALRQNSQSWADAFETASEWYKNKDSFADGVKNSYLARHDWLRGKVQEYVEIGKRHGVFAEGVDSKYTL